jgi:predicted MFS family arabinose efflux permease
MTGTDPERIWTRDFTLLFCSSLLFYGAFNFLNPTLPILMIDRLACSRAQVGMITSIMAVTAMLARPFGGYALDRFGRRLVYMGALVMAAVTVVLHIAVSSIASLVLVRIAYGMPFGVITAAILTVAGDIVPPSRRGEALGIFVLSQTIATAVGPFLAIIVLRENQFERLFLVATAMALGAAALALLVRFPNVRDPQVRFSVSSFLDGRVAPVACTVAFQGLAYSSILSFLSLYGRELGVANVGVFYLANGLGLVASRATAGRAFDRSGPKKVLSLGFFVFLVGYVLLGAWRSPTGFLTAGLLYGIGYGLTFPTLQTMAISQVPPERRGAASSTFFNGFDVGVSSGSYSMGFVAQAMGGYGPMYLVCAAILVIPLLLAISWVEPRYRPWKPQA